MKYESICPRCEKKVILESRKDRFVCPSCGEEFIFSKNRLEEIAGIFGQLSDLEIGYLSYWFKTDPEEFKKTVRAFVKGIEPCLS